MHNRGHRQALEESVRRCAHSVLILTEQTSGPKSSEKRQRRHSNATMRCSDTSAARSSAMARRRVFGSKPTGSVHVFASEVQRWSR